MCQCEECEEEAKKGKKKEEMDKWRDIKNSFSRCEVELLGCCHATDGLRELCCTMMTVACQRELAGREQAEFKSTHYACVCVCVCLIQSIWSKLPTLCAAIKRSTYIHTHTITRTNDQGPIQYEAVSGYSAFYDGLVIWSYKV